MINHVTKVLSLNTKVYLLNTQGPQCLGSYFCCIYI